MNDPILLLRLEGPLQSWGVRSRWSRRDTGPEPSKSAIIGLLGCAAGIARHNWHTQGEPNRTLEQWEKSLGFGVRVDRPGMVETDYHTVQGCHWQADGKMKTGSSHNGAPPDIAEVEPPHTEITWRDYLHDAASLVVLALKPKHKDANQGLMEHLKDCLLSPKWPMYLGRKTCVPTRPILDRLTYEYEDLEEALKKEPWAAPISPKERKALQRSIQAPNLLAWIEDWDGEHMRQDAIRLNQLRFYDFRRCRRIEIDAGSLIWRIA